MEITEVKRQIKEKQFSPFYIFGAEDLEVAKLYIDMMVKNGGFKLQYVDRISDVFSKLRTSSLLSFKTLYVVFNDKDFLRDEKAWSKLRMIKDDVVILEYTDVDRRLKFWKNFKDRAVFFEHLPNRILTKHIQKKLGFIFKEEDCDKLIEVCESDYGRIMLEVDKIERYAQYRWNNSDFHARDGGAENMKEAFYEMLKDGTIFVPAKDAIFDFVNAVLDRNARLAYDLLEDCYAVGEANMVIISVLYTNFRNLLQVQTCNSSNIGKSTGLNGFQIKCVKPYVDKYNDYELIAALDILRECEKGIKTGEIPDNLSTNYALMHIL